MVTQTEGVKNEPKMADVINEQPLICIMKEALQYQYKFKRQNTMIIKICKLSCQINLLMTSLITPSLGYYDTF